jgi:hypothetical protein
VKDAGRGTAARPRRRWQTAFDANFASPAYLIETVVCYPSCCASGIRNLSRHAASIMSLRARRTAVSQFARSQYVVNYKAEQAIHRRFLRTI